MQLLLFPTEPRPDGDEPPREQSLDLDTLPPAAPEDERRQFPLFSAWTELWGSLEQALADADFARAKSACTEIKATYSPAGLPAWAETLEHVPDELWDQGALSDLLAHWQALDARLPAPAQRRRFRHAFFRKLFLIHPPESVAAQAAAFLPQIAGTLAEWGDTRRARLLVRDRLLDRFEVPAIPEDPALADLLSEDLAPLWLAALGAIRRLWPLTQPDPEERAAISARLNVALPDDDAARALAFWDTLRLAECRSELPDPVLHAARRHLKRLHPELHAAYLNRSGEYV